ncbi:hypothetical protein BDF19DRAFT_431955 [Syncephalis fuscata]|nr:hypothetical protein BDF19DRAFT_431928 [Syncephalis fuscata]KAI9598287.1 hypothetical protein BDF19DRAFT_431955 [Syncephalis fuscata]
MSNKNTAATRKWAFDFSTLDRSKNRGPRSAPKDPLGFIAGSGKSSKGNIKHSRTDSVDAHANLKIKRAWDAALAPGKSLPMNGFMLWMSGNGVQIFSIMITAMLFFQPVKAIMSLNTAFERFEIKGTRTAGELTLPKLVFVLMNVLTILLGIYKLSAMGLLPTATSDWLAFMEPKKILEHGLV